MEPETPVKRIRSVLLLFRFPPAASFLLIVLFTLGFQPLRADLRATNVNQLQLAWFALGGRRAR